MNICMLVHAVYHRDPRVRRYAEYLAHDGHTVHIICLDAEKPVPLEPQPGIRVHAIPLTRNRREGAGQALEWGISAVLMFLRLTWLDLRYRFDLIHVNNMPDFIVFCAIVPRLRGCPVILDVHDPIPEVMMSKMVVPRSHPLVRALTLLEKLSVRFVNHVLTATASFKRILVGRGAPVDKVTVVMNAADPKVFEGSEKGVAGSDDGFTILYVGTVAPRYGVDVFVRALPKIRAEIPGSRFRVFPKIVKEGKGLHESLALARELGVEDLIDLSEPVPLEDMPDVMRSADVGIYPARLDCHMDIALSLKIPEMALVGLPIVSTRLQVLQELFGEDSIVFVAPEDPDALADAIIELYRNPDERRERAEKARAKAQGFSWDTQYAAYRQVLDTLVRQDSQSSGE